MPFRISKEFTFSAAHQLRGLAFDHPCMKLHGHNYVVKVLLEADTVDKVGFVRDYRELDVIKEMLDKSYDHKHLNDRVPNGMNTTAENLAQLIFEFAVSHFPEVVAVGVSETPKTWAWYGEKVIPV